MKSFNTNSIKIKNIDIRKELATKVEGALPNRFQVRPKSLDFLLAN